MAENTKIEWCHHTMNFWLGCTKVSGACDFCYAESWAKRIGKSYLWNGNRLRTSAENWLQPFKWNARAVKEGTRYRVFTNSLADFFDNQVSFIWLADALTVIRQTPDLDWMILTNRPQNIRKMLGHIQQSGIDAALTVWLGKWLDGEPPRNVWLGTTAENQEEADRRIPHLLRIPAQIHFVSYEPALGPVDFTEWLWGRAEPCQECPQDCDCDCGLHPRHEIDRWHSLNLIIAGGESGPKARPSHPAWYRTVRDDCVASGTAFHFKQRGAWTWIDDGQPLPWLPNKPQRAAVIQLDGSIIPAVDQSDTDEAVFFVGKDKSGRLLDGREWNEMPAGV